MARLRTGDKKLIALIAGSDHPVYLLDETRRIVFCNAACAQWLGVGPEDLLGERCDFHAGDEGHSDYAAALCPPPESFRGAISQRRLVWNPEGTGLQERQAWFYPIMTDGDCVGVLAATDEVTPAAGPPTPPTDAESVELHRQLERMVRRHSDRFRLERLVGDSPQSCRLREQVRIASATAAHLNIVGPPGAGREHLARTIHSARTGDPPGPLMPLDGQLLDAELLQATLLAFLDRCRDLPEAGTGTVLLLAGDQLSPIAQTELLGFLSLPTVDLQVIVTSRSSLLELARQGGFDMPLALLLSPLTIEVPALSSRRGDIPLLAQQFLERVNARGEKQVSGFSCELLDLLGALPWQRNLDELAEVVELIHHNSEPGTLACESSLPDRVRQIVLAGKHYREPEESLQLDAFLAEVERELLQRAMQKAQGNKAQAARLLGIQRSRLIRRLSQLAVD